MAGVLYVVDLDGTLLQPDARLSPRTRALLAELLAAGAPITIASARSAVSMRPILDGLDLALPVVELNGAFLSVLATGAHYWVRSLRPQVAASVLDLFAGSGLPPFLSTYDGRRDRLYAPPPANPGMRWYLDDRKALGDERLTPAADVRVGLRDQVVCLTAIGERESVAALRDRVKSAWDESVQIQLWENEYSPGWYWLTVQDRLATKDAAVAELVVLRGLGDVEVVAFGDQANDAGLLAMAHRGVAVANAIPEILAVADEVIGPNTDDSVARYIQADWRSRR